MTHQELEFDFIKLIHDSGGRANASLILRFKALIDKHTKEYVEEILDEIGKTISQTGFDSENRLKQDEKTELHNRGRAFGYLEALSDIRKKVK